ncbi:DegV family EDD domain-containing protein [Candidatus Saccharibacteria bacterium]|nr:DegV family EDD domain-containing protein [Candidatus Saccharibacteria bacterium]
MAIKLFVDATADLQSKFLREHPEIVVIDTPIIVNSKTDSMQFDNLTPDDFQHIDRDYSPKKGYRITTSSPTILDPDLEIEGSVATLAYQAVKAGYAVLYLAMGSGMSGTYFHAKLCFDELREEYLIPKYQLQAVDSRCMSTGTAMLVNELYENFDFEALNDVAPVVDYIEKHRDHIMHFFTWTNLDYIVKSGRVSAIKGATAKFLRLLPIGAAVYTGEDMRALETVTSLNSPRNLNRFADIVGEYIERHLVTPDSPITVAYANNPDAGYYLAMLLGSRLPRAQIIDGYRLSSAIQAHGGPTSLHVNFHADVTPTLEEMTAEISQIISAL